MQSGSSLISIYANILHLRFTDTFAQLPASTLNEISRNNFWLRLGHIILYTGGRLILNLFLPLRHKEEITNKVWLYVVSKNNYESLQFLNEELPHTVFVAGQNKQISLYNDKVNRLSTRFKLFYIYKFPFLLRGLYKLKGYRAMRFFDLIYIATGYYELSLSYLKKYRPKAIIFANDHNTDSRALLLAAKKLNIPTIYIQHASVSTSFPALQFDLNLLEGQDALNKYRLCGPINGDVKLIGMPKADAYLKEKNTRLIITNIGVCANIIDDLKAIKELLSHLINHFPEYTIAFRPHPGDNRDFSFIDKLGSKIIVSNSKKEGAFDFLKKQDLIIAADSSIHLEATMLNILSFYYRFGTSNFVYDYYGYVKQGLVEAAPDLERLISLIQHYQNNRPDVTSRAQYYNAVMGTANEGRSHELALQHIQEFLNLKRRG